MDYKRHYDLLMEKARQRGTVEGYKERHHIIPRCMGGGNGKDNLVELTAREHYVAHRLLYMHYKTRQMAYAWISMCRGNRTQQRNITSRQYEQAKRAMADSQKGTVFSEETRKKMSDKLRKRVITDETRKKLSIANTGRPKSPETVQKLRDALRGKPKSEEHKLKLSQANLGKRMSEEERKKRSIANKGKVPWNKGKQVSEEVRKKMSAANKGQVPWNKGLRRNPESTPLDTTP